MDFDMSLTVRLFFRRESGFVLRRSFLISDVYALFYSIYFLFDFNTEFHHFVIQTVESFVARIA